MIIMRAKKITSKPARIRHLLFWVKIVFEKHHFISPIYIEGVDFFYESALFFYKLFW